MTDYEALLLPLGSRVGIDWRITHPEAVETRPTLWCGLGRALSVMRTMRDGKEVVLVEVETSYSREQDKPPVERHWARPEELCHR